MARVSTYLNFKGQTEEAFNFYKTAFGTEFTQPIQYMRDVPRDGSSPELSEAEQGMVMHVELPILAGHILMGTDVLSSMERDFTVGDNISINLEPDTRAEVDRLYAALEDGSGNNMKPTEMFWGGYYADCRDKFGVRWMFNTEAK